jgi:putative endonuclease
MAIWNWFVYIILCDDYSYYTGLTWNPSIRFDQHMIGGSEYTKQHKPKKVVHLERFEDLESARKREKQIKGWSRFKKEKLINGEWGKWE